MAKDNGNGDNRHGTFHFWSEFARAMKQKEDQPTVMEEFHLDCTGKKRLFRLSEHPRGLISFLEAVELRDGEPTGLRFVEGYNEELEIPPWYQIRQRIAERLATRDLVRDPDTGRLEVLKMLIRAQVDHAEDEDGGPDLFIDDMVVTWDELGDLLRTYEGWGLEIRIVER